MKNSIRITGGDLKGRKVSFDFKNTIRPTSSKLREVLFNWLQFEIKGCECLDLFAGTGSLGIEAISRGASKLIFIESNKKNFLSLKECISELDLEKKSKVLFKNGLSWINENDLSNFDLIFLDPPFKDNKINKLIEIIKRMKITSKKSLIIIHRNKKIVENISKDLIVSKEKNYGLSKIIFGKIY